MAKLTIRATFRVDTGDQMDLSFMRAVLRRLNVLHCTVKGGDVKDIIAPNEIGTLHKDHKAATVPTTVRYLPAAHVTPACAVVADTRPWRSRDRSKTHIVYIPEIRMPMPVVVDKR